MPDHTPDNMDANARGILRHSQGRCPFHDLPYIPKTTGSLAEKCLACDDEFGIDNSMDTLDYWKRLAAENNAMTAGVPG